MRSKGGSLKLQACGKFYHQKFLYVGIWAYIFFILSCNQMHYKTVTKSKISLDAKIIKNDIENSAYFLFAISNSQGISVLSSIFHNMTHEFDHLIVSTILNVSLIFVTRYQCAFLPFIWYPFRPQYHLE